MPKDFEVKDTTGLLTLAKHRRGSVNLVLFCFLHEHTTDTRNPKEKAQEQRIPILCWCPVILSVIPIRVHPQEIQLAQFFVILPSQLASSIHFQFKNKAMVATSWIFI